MESISFITEGLFVLVGLILIAAVIKYPKDVFVTIPLGILSAIARKLAFFLYPLWLIIKFIDRGLKFNFLDKYSWNITTGSHDSEDNDYEYDSQGQLNFNFGSADKFILTTNLNIEQIRKLIQEGIVPTEQPIKYDVQKVSRMTTIQFTNIDLYNFCLLIQHLDNELTSNKVIGTAFDDDIYFLCWQDTNTLNNIVGFTNTKEKIHYSMYRADEYLSTNNRIMLTMDKIPRTFKSWIEMRTVYNSSYKQ